MHSLHFTVVPCLSVRNGLLKVLWNIRAWRRRLTWSRSHSKSLRVKIRWRAQLHPQCSMYILHEYLYVTVPWNNRFVIIFTWWLTNLEVSVYLLFKEVYLHCILSFPHTPLVTTTPDTCVFIFGRRTNHFLPKICDWVRLMHDFDTWITCSHRS